MSTVRETIEKLQKMDPDSHVAYILWQEEDVIGYGENEFDPPVHITLEEARNILDDIDSKGNCEEGITWDTIRWAILEYPISDPNREKGLEEDKKLFE